MEDDRKPRGCKRARANGRNVFALVCFCAAVVLCAGIFFINDMSLITQKWERLISKITWLGPRVKSGVYPLDLPLEPGDKGFQSYFLFNGSTGRLAMLGAHASALRPGVSPHPPHAHKEEEVLLLLSGELDLIFPDDTAGGNEKKLRIKPHQVLYYPPDFFHTIESVGDQPANYVMYKWETDSDEKNARRDFGRFDLFDLAENAGIEEGFSPRSVFEWPTASLKKLRCHTSTLTPGAGYAPHADDYDVAIIVLEGEVETIGERVRPHNIIYYAAGDPHGIHNPGQVTAKYVVFEFHGRKCVVLRRLFKRLRLFLSKRLQKR